MSRPKCRTGQQPRLRPLVPGETPIRLWAPAPREDWRRVRVSAYLPALLPFLIKLLPPTQIACWGQLPCKPRSRKEGPSRIPNFFKALSPRDTEPTSARGMHPQKRTEKPERKEHLPATRLPWQRAAPGGKWCRLALAPGGRDTASGAEAPHPLRGRPEQTVSPGGRCSVSARARARGSGLPRMGEAGVKVIAGAPALPCPRQGLPRLSW